MEAGYLVLEDGQVFKGNWLGGKPSAGEVVFNTAHNGYEEIATDPSYYGQIMVMCAPQQGNYGVDRSFWESRQLWIQGFIALDIQQTPENSQWLERLEERGIPAIDSMDTRKLVLHLRQRGTQVGAMVSASDKVTAQEKAKPLIGDFREQKQKKDWVYEVSCGEPKALQGVFSRGPRVAVLDFGCKENILRELMKRCSQVMVYPSRHPASEILKWEPHGVLLSNGPGDPERVEGAVETIGELLGRKPIFGICMGHQLLGRALGGRTSPLKFGHRGVNHPIKNVQTGEVYMTSQNHGYVLDKKGLDPSLLVTHVNLNDQTVAGIQSLEKKCFSVQYHPESHPGPRDAEGLFDQFVRWMR